MKKDRLYNFGDMVGRGGRLKYVYPPKQRVLCEVLDTLPDTVEKLYVFGSSITLRCGRDSDVDICLIGNISANELNQISYSDSPVDVIYCTQEQFDKYQRDEYDNVYKDVLNTGLLLYDRGNLTQ